jgi:hypothetical protein
MYKLIGIFLIIASVATVGYSSWQSGIDAATTIKIPGHATTIKILGHTTTVNISQNNKLTSGLVGQWSFNGLDVTDKVYDRSGQGNNGYIIGQATSSAKTVGKVGQALSFDGVNDYVDIGMNIGLLMESAPAITMTAWLKPRGYPTGRAGALTFIIHTIVVAEIGGRLGFQDGNLEVGGRSVSTIDSFQSATTTFPELNTWHFATGVLDFANNKIEIYIDGVLKITKTVTFANSTYAHGFSTNKDTIGSYIDTTEFFNGSIDEVRIYNRALSASEVARLYNLGR